MLSDSSNCSDSIGKEKLPISFSEFSKKLYLSQQKARVERNCVHLFDGCVVLVMIKWSFYNSFAHVMIVVVVGK